MTAAMEPERFFARRREVRRAQQADVFCRRCYGTGHEKKDCEVPLRIFTNGADVLIAVSSDRAARICNDPLGSDSPADLYSVPSDWTLVEVDTAEINGTKAPPGGWIDLYGEGWLVIDGELVPRWP